MLGIKKQPSAARCFIGAGMRVNGECVFEGELQVEGKIVGAVTSAIGQPGVLVIGEAGRVEGAITADRVVIAGTVIGPVQVRELLELHATARVQGDVSYKALEMQQGAVIAGQLQPQTMPPAASAGPVESTLEP
jgi:cytoskeletal protein CcmA (bactofilin family)